MRQLRSRACRAATAALPFMALLGVLLAVPGAARAEMPPPGSPLAPSPVVTRLLALIEASPERCAPAPATGADVRTLEADIALFRQRVPAAADVPVQLRDCYWDGMAVRGHGIVLSVRLARATPAQRFFVIAHEFGHIAGGHHARLADLVEQLLRDRGDAEAVADALRQGAGSPLSRSNEAEADAYAVALMLEAGLDPEDAARLVDPAGGSAGAGLASHPAPRARAAAIRAQAGQRLVVSR